MILERAGYKVIAIANPDEAARAFATYAIDAVVFGGSIHADQRTGLARTFKRLNAAVPIIALSKTSGSQVPAGIVDEQLESLGDPQLLLEALKRVLGRDGDGEAPSRTAPARASDGPANDAEATKDGATGAHKSKKSAV